MKKEKVKQLIREYIEVREKMDEIETTLDSLNKRTAKISAELYENRSKEFIEGVVFCLGELMDEFPQSNAFDELQFEIKVWLDVYDASVSSRLKYADKKERLMYKEKIIP